jgi:translation initiation factor IF-1
VEVRNCTQFSADLLTISGPEGTAVRARKVKRNTARISRRMERRKATICEGDGVGREGNK